MLGVTLRRFVHVMGRVEQVCVGEVRVMRRLLVAAGLVVFRRLLVMVDRVLVMLSRLPVMLCRLL